VHFLFSVLSIIAIDLVLAGDNAVVIAMAVRHLPEYQRKRGIAFGAAAAVVLRVVATFFVAQLLQLPLVKLAGGATVFWIALHLFTQDSPGDTATGTARNLWQAVQLIVIADISLSIDNMLAVGGASHGSLPLLVFGLAVSVPFVVFASNVLSRLMARYPIVVLGGAALLGKVAAEMMIEDPLLDGVVHFARWQQITIETGAAAVVVLAGRGLARRRAARMAATTPGVIAEDVTNTAEAVETETF
jgi:YjbE family integral membrane protein